LGTAAQKGLEHFTWPRLVQETEEALRGLVLQQSSLKGVAHPG
jgi:hypothetical protein